MRLFGSGSSSRLYLRHRETLVTAGGRVFNRLGFNRVFSIMTNEDTELKEFTDYLENLKNYEKSGVPKDAGTDSEDGFDLGRMQRLMHSLGNPQSKFKAVHIAGTKGKGSTSAFLSSILRAEGYSVGCYTSPHIRTIRERISLGKLGEPVSAKAVNALFQRIKKILHQAADLEKGRLSHFEVFTAVAFSLFAEQNVDIAVIEAGLGGARDATNIISSSELAASIITTIGEEHLDALGGSLESIAIAKSGIIKTGRPVSVKELEIFPRLATVGGDKAFLCGSFEHGRVAEEMGSRTRKKVVLGGPYIPHIEHILRDKASSMCSPVISASDPGNRSKIKGISYVSGKLCQSCDVVLEFEKDLPLFLELFDINMCMLGPHQLQNAATATSAALCLRNQGWRISDTSIRAGLERTYLLGRSQILSSDEVEALELAGATIILDGAHTKESAKALADTIQMTFPEARLVLVVAMASDKDHVAFARELLSVRQLEAIFLTEVSIAGDRYRTTSLSLLKDRWNQASKEVNREILDCGVAEYYKLLKNQSALFETDLQNKTLLFTDSSLMASMKTGNQLLKATKKDQSEIKQMQLAVFCFAASRGFGHVLLFARWMTEIKMVFGGLHNCPINLGRTTRTK